MMKPIDRVFSMRTAIVFPASRPAFTLIEVFMVLAIIGVLISLLLPAIQSTREQARRVQCQNNLLQLGTALANYHSSHGVLPPGVVNDRGPVTARPGGYRFGWAVQILPYLGQMAMYQEFNFRHGVDSARERPPHDSTGFRASSVLRPPPRAACPTPRATTTWRRRSTPTTTASSTSTAARVYDDITDGPAFTIFVGEGAILDDPRWLGRGRSGDAPKHGNPDRRRNHPAFSRRIHRHVLRERRYQGG